jgi:hypothetical protein
LFINKPETGFFRGFRMKRQMILAASAFFMSIVSPSLGLERPDVEFKIFQFPNELTPRIDGKADDWDIVPDEYAIGLDQLEDSVKKTKNDKNNFDVSVKVGWVKGLDKLFFLYEAYDDYWDFSLTDHHNDTFEIVVDGDLSGREFQVGLKEKSLYDGYLFRGLYAQNYHICTPAEGKSPLMIWGPQWATCLPWSNVVCSYNFRPGESGRLTLECYITPLDYAPQFEPEKAVVSKLEVNKIIGLAWACVDYDDVKASSSNYRAWYSLTHKTPMFRDASALCAFRLMPLEKRFRKPVEAEWSYSIVDLDRGLVSFKDMSYGNITSWKWDFGDGETSMEQNPIHRYTKPSVNYTITLYVEGPEGKARMAKPWCLAIKEDAGIQSAEKKAK